RQRPSRSLRSTGLRGRGGHRGGRISHTRGNPQSVTAGRRIPIYMASTSSFARERSFPARPKVSFSRRREAPYIFVHWAGAIGFPAGKAPPNVSVKEGSKKTTPCSPVHE